MQTTTFTTTAHAKCILAGEHSVIRGYSALVLPIIQKSLTLSFYPAKEVHSHHLNREKQLLDILFWKTLNYGLELLNKPALSHINGQFSLDSNLEVGAGLGFSSALCVVIARWFLSQQWIEKEQLFEFARKLENLYHGKSSGIDIAGAMADGLVLFKRPYHMQGVEMNWKPNFYLSYSDYAKNTREAVDQVDRFIQANSQAAKLIDEQMEKSVLIIQEALRTSKDQGLSKLIFAIEQAQDCFAQWGLINSPLQKSLVQLYALGALAVKPTGSGLGGYLLSVWDHAPPENSGIEFISI